MKKIGNVASNRTFNPQNSKPPIPLDVDEVDSAMEKFIRQKYDSRTLSGHAPRVSSRQPTTHFTGGSDDDPPPPPPPKNGKLEKPSRRFKFGLRSASSALPLSRHSQDPPPISPEPPRKLSRLPSPIRVNKQSRVFGASIGVTEEGMEWKLVTLKEMGFPDDKRNSNVLKGLNGDLERAIESLVRLGEGTTAASKPRTPASATFPEVNRSTPNLSTDRSKAASNASSGQRQLQRPAQIEEPQQVRNRVVTSPPLSSQQQSYNPFENMNPMSAPLQQPPPLEQAFQNMHVTQPLFPNATGGYPNQQQQLQQARQQYSMTPVPQMPQQYISTNPYAQQSTASYNPFANANQSSSSPISANQYFTPQQTATAPNPYLIPQQSSNSFFPQQNQLQPQPQPQQTQQIQQVWNQQPLQNNPQSFSPSTQPHPQFVPSQSYFTQEQQQPYPLTPQRTGRIDKSSILALYNYPHLAPPPLPQSSDPSNPNNTDTSPNPQLTPPANASRAINAPSIAQNQRSVTMPASLAAGSKNPFLMAKSPEMAGDAGSGQGEARGRHVSVESMESGRHSPDAFASLSARFVR